MTTVLTDVAALSGESRLADTASPVLRLLALAAQTLHTAAHAPRCRLHSQVAQGATVAVLAVAAVRPRIQSHTRPLQAPGNKTQRGTLNKEGHALGESFCLFKQMMRLHSLVALTGTDAGCSCDDVGCVCWLVAVLSRPAGVAETLRTLRNTCRLPH